MFLDKINNWILKFKPYFFSYSNGFFKFYYLANSPELLVNSIKKMPTVTCDEKNNTIFLKNSFLKSSLRYIELEKGLWLLNAKVFFKNNIISLPMISTNTRNTTKRFVTIVNFNYK